MTDAPRSADPTGTPEGLAGMPGESADNAARAWTIDDARAFADGRAALAERHYGELDRREDEPAEVAFVWAGHGAWQLVQTLLGEVDDLPVALAALQAAAEVFAEAVETVEFGLGGGSGE